MLVLNSDKFAIVATLAIAALRVAMLLGQDAVDIGRDWLFYLLYVFLCYGLFQGLRPIADAVTGKDYIRSWSTYGMEKIFKNRPLKYTIDLSFAIVGLGLLLYMMFGIWK